MKVLLVCHQFFPRHRTGTEVLTLALAKELQKRGAEVAVLAAEPVVTEDGGRRPGIIYKEAFEGLPVYRLYCANDSGMKRLKSEAQPDGAWEALLGKLFQEYRPDVIHVLHFMRFGTHWVRMAQAMGIRVVFTVTDYWLMCPTYQLLRGNDVLCNGPQTDDCLMCLMGLAGEKAGLPWISDQLRKLPAALGKRLPFAKGVHDQLRRRITLHKEIIGAMDGVIWANAFARNIFHANGFLPQREMEIPFPLPPGNESLKDLPFPDWDTGLQVGFVGTFRHSKGPHVMLQAARLLSHRKDIHFSLWGGYGASEYGSMLRQMANDHPNIRFCGTFPQEQFYKVLEKLHVLVLPSLWYENTPLTGLTARKAGRILAVSDVGGMRELLVPKESGFLFPPGDAKALAKLLEEIAQKKERLQFLRAQMEPPLGIEEYVSRSMMMYGAVSG